MLTTMFALVTQFTVERFGTMLWLYLSATYGG
jgi:hypothetical protein